MKKFLPLMSKVFKFRGENACLVNTDFVEVLNPGFVYGIRHADDDWDEPISVEWNVRVNRWGWLLSQKALLATKLVKSGKEVVPFIKLTKKEREHFRNQAYV